jgi:hypothetical protein
MRVHRVISAFLGKVIGLKGYGASVEFRIVPEDGLGVGVYGIRGVQMAENQPVGVIGGHLHSIQDGVHAKGGIVEQLGGVFHSLALYGLPGLQEEEAHGCYEDNTGQGGYNDIEPAGEGGPEKV